MTARTFHNSAPITRAYLVECYRVLLEEEPDNLDLIRAYEAVILDNSTQKQAKEFSPLIFSSNAG